VTRIVDLTMTWPDVPTYPGHPEPTIHRIASFETHGKQVSKLEIGTHSGTHIDAPRHYISGGNTIDDIPLEVLCGPAYMIDTTALGGAEGGLNAETIADYLDNVRPERLLVRFDGPERLGSMAYYREQPWLTEDAAQWLIDNGCKLIGLDTPMPDAWANIETMPIHKMLLGAGVVIAEYLINLDRLRGKGGREISHIVGPFDLIVAPLKIKDGDGAPARCFAIVRD
jgi:arylformamidase